MAQVDRVFLVDDDPGIQDAVRWLLEAAQIGLSSYSSAVAFLQDVDLMQPGCLLLDICMPQMSGVELQEKLLSENNVMSIVFLTGQADVATTSRVFKNGAYDLLEKPVDAKLLIDVVKKALEASKEKAQVFYEFKELQRCIDLLTKRERDILRLVLGGYSNKGIAEELHLALRTVEIHRHNMMSKMNQESAIKLAHLVSKYANRIKI